VTSWLSDRLCSVSKSSIADNIGTTHNGTVPYQKEYCVNSNLQPQVDAHQISLDLDGLDDLLVVSPQVIEVVQEEDIPAEERQLLLSLLDQIASVNTAVDEARDRLAAANERMSSLATIVQLQTGQLELLSHYQNQAARAVSLERHIAELEAENANLKQTWWRRLLSVFKK
jgi:hypothetical protein